MTIKGLIDEDFVNCCLPSMFVAFPRCTFKCCAEAGCEICQNLPLAKDPDIEIAAEDIVRRYIENPISKALVLGGLEPFDSFDDLLELTKKFRAYMTDDIVIYTGYDKAEIADKITKLKAYPNIVVKFGRFKPNSKPVRSTLLGVTLASDNQYAERIS